VDNIRAGWARIDITPPLGLPMGGRGARFTDGASIRDPLYAQACALEDGAGHRTLWISIDLIGLASAIGLPLRVDVAAYTGIPREAVILNYAHTHSGPMTNFDKYPILCPKPEGLRAYEQALRYKILRVACDAVDRLRPSSITLYQGASDVGINRRNRNEVGEMAMAPNPAGAYNPELWVMDVVASDGGRCVVFNYGCHAVIAYGFTYDAISADYPAVARQHVAEVLGSGVHCQFVQGLAGNVRPRVLADLEQGRFRKATPADLEQAGRELAGDVVNALAGSGEPLDLELRAAGGWFQAMRDVDAIPPLAHWQAMAKRGEELYRNIGRYWSAFFEAGWPAVRATPWEMGLLQLTPERRIAWLAGEVVAEWGPHLRRWLDDENLIVWGYCQDLPGYLPTDELLPEGGYEVAQSNLNCQTGPAPLATGVNEAVRKRVLGLAEQIALDKGE
jgi:neutral ceramidase